MEKEKAIVSWLLAKYESGKETDVVMRETMWHDFTTDNEFTKKGTAIPREEFFSYVGRCISEHNFKGLKTMRSKGKKIGYRGLREKQVCGRFDVEVKGQEMESGEGRRHDNGNEESKAIEKARQERSLSAPAVIPAEPDNDTVEGVNQSMQDCDVDSEEVVEDVQKTSNADLTTLSSFFMQDVSTKGDEIQHSHTLQMVEDPVNAKEPLHGNCFSDIACYTKGEGDKVTGTRAAEVTSSSSFNGDISMENNKSGSPGIARQQVEEKEAVRTAIGVRDNSNNENEWVEEVYHQGFSSKGSSSGEDLQETSDETAQPKDVKRRRLKAIKRYHRISSSSSCSSTPTKRSGRYCNDWLESSPRKKKPAYPESQKQRRSGQHHSSYSDDEEDSPKRFFERHHKKLKSLLPKHLPGSPKSFHDYLSRLFKVPNSHNERRIELHSHSGDTIKHDYARCRSFLATAFPPIKVGQVAGGEVDHTFPGDMFPQFTHHQKSVYHCELCIPYQMWARKEGLKHAALKSKSVKIDDIMRGTAILHFSGVVQVHEHFSSKAHQEAIEFFKSNAMEKVTKVNDSKSARQKSTLTNFFKPKMPLN